jgi:ATP-dependent RNA/DNA helicase IGHMBP2
MDYFKQLLELLKIERRDDQEAYLKLTQTTSVTDRRAAGMAWYPIAIRGTEPARGDYITVEVERPSHQDVSHQFRFGAAVALFSNHDATIDRVNGTVTFIGGNTAKITLLTDELPDWTRNGKLGIELLFDDNSYDEMQNALKLASSISDKPAEGRLIQILTGQKVPVFTDVENHYTVTGLNDSQQIAVDKIIAAQDMAIVHGPPGTGKTTTLTQAIKTLINNDKKQILVVAPSNTAVDLLSEKLTEAGLNVLRIGNPARVSERLMNLTLDSKISTHPQVKDIKKLKKQAAEYKNMAHKYKRSFGRAEREQRKALFDEAHKIMRDAGKIEEFISNDLIEKAQVITATLVGANHYTIRSVKFHTVVIDEAGQAIEPACWIPILKAQKLIMAGDHLQLPPTVKSAEAARKGLTTTLLEKCVVLHPEAVVLLNEQYRMHQQIMGFSSAAFYDDALKANAFVANRILFTDDMPLSFVDTAGCGYEEKQEGTSTYNPEEAGLLYKHLVALTEKLKVLHKDSFPSIAIISPYKEQVRILKAQLADVQELQPYMAYIDVNTIDSFQGQERDVVYISMTRSNNNGEIGFLADTRRMNVAMTRAKMKLVVIGDSATLSQLPFYTRFIDYAQHHGGYQSAWEYL